MKLRFGKLVAHGAVEKRHLNKKGYVFPSLEPGDEIVIPEGATIEVCDTSWDQRGTEGVVEGPATLEWLRGGSPHTLAMARVIEGKFKRGCDLSLYGGDVIYR